MFEELFMKKKVNFNKLIDYGFKKEKDHYSYSVDIFEHQFLLKISISTKGIVTTYVYDHMTDEEYILYKTKAKGEFVERVRFECETVLKDIVEKCYEEQIFQYAQTQRIIRFVKEKYHDDLEFLWKNVSDNAVWRRKDSQKWYGALLTVSRNKLGLDSLESVEIIDLRAQPEVLQQLLLQEGYYPGWHMNKKHWYTIILDDSLNDEVICHAIDESYKIAKK